jgi:acetyl-CoA carboxylase biotin carboxylase subunit
LIAAAKQTGADAIHPGYGFLSESSDFARRCAKEGIIWIGPSPEAMEMMGDKITARKTMIEAGVPVVPGVQHDLSLEEAKKVIKEIGYPVIVKASAGGGGKGMRVIRKDEEIEEAYNTAKSEALSSFANGTLYIEKYIENPHHIEFQILGDNFGNVIHLCERECSVQRRHQKIVEESPSPMMTADLRKDMGEKAIMAAKAVNYSGAGTIEFLVDDNKNYYFLEMNTRLQVEHPITEEVLRIDLVKEQINVANNLPLRLHQEDIVQRGHAIECRICAEDTENNFMPSPGIIQQLTEPLGIGTRVDNYVYEGYEIPVFYDPMIGKLIVWATTRAYAIKRMRRVLFEYKITGIKTNINYLRRIMDASDFLRGKYDTGFIEKNSEFLLDEHYEGSQDETEDIAIIAAYMDYILNLEENATKTTDNRVISKWREFGKRNAMLRI